MICLSSPPPPTPPSHPRFTPNTSAIAVDTKFRPYEKMWASASECAKNLDAWFDGSVRKVDPDVLRPTVKLFMTASKELSLSFKASGDHDGQQASLALKEAAYELDSVVPVLSVLSSPSLRQRHVNELCDVLGMAKDDSARHFTSSLTLRVFLRNEVMSHLKALVLIGHTADCEHKLELELGSMKAEVRVSWRGENGTVRSEKTRTHLEFTITPLPSTKGNQHQDPPRHTRRDGHGEIRSCRARRHIQASASGDDKDANFDLLRPL